MHMIHCYWVIFFLDFFGLPGRTGYHSSFCRIFMLSDITLVKVKQDFPNNNECRKVAYKRDILRTPRMIQCSHAVLLWSYWSTKLEALTMLQIKWLTTWYMFVYVLRVNAMCEIIGIETNPNPVLHGIKYDITSVPVVCWIWQVLYRICCCMCMFLVKFMRRAHELSKLNWNPFILMLHYQNIHFRIKWRKGKKWTFNISHTIDSLHHPSFHYSWLVIIVGMNWVGKYCHSVS